MNGQVAEKATASATRLIETLERHTQGPPTEAILARIEVLAAESAVVSGRDVEALVAAEGRCPVRRGGL